MDASVWKILPYLSREQIRSYERAGLNRYIAQLLVNRGIKDADKMQSFLEARYESTGDPLTLVDMPRAVERILRALDQREHITVYGDYDADGVTSAAVLYRALKNLQH